MSGGGKGSKTSTSTQTVSGPAWYESHLKRGLSAAGKDYAKGPTKFYPEQTYADFTPEQELAMGMVRDRAMAGSPIVDTAQSVAQRTLEGEFLGSNPYMDEMLSSFAKKANAQALSQFNRSGRLGSGANVATASQAISDATLPYLFNNYQAERQNQMNTMNNAGAIADLDYNDAARLSLVGEQQQAMNQQGINEAMSRYYWENGGASDANLDQYLSRMNASPAANYTTTTNTQTQKGGGGLGSMIGAGLSLAGTAMGFPGVGMGFGAALTNMGMPSIGNALMRQYASGYSPLASGGGIYWN